MTIYNLNVDENILKCNKLRKKITVLKISGNP